MPRVRFIEPFDWDPPEHGGRTTIAFARGHEGLVRRECAEAALRAGAAVAAEPAEADEDPA